MQRDIINLIKNMGDEFDIDLGIYLVGSYAYKKYKENWSDLDFVVISSRYSERLETRVREMVIKINTEYKGILAGGGDAIIDIEYITLESIENLTSGNYSTYKSNLICSTLRILDHGELLFGTNYKAKLDIAMRRSDKKDLANSLVTNCLERINYYYNIYDINSIDINGGSIKKFAPHKKYKVILWLFINVAMCTVTLDTGELNMKKDEILRKFSNEYSNENKIWDKVFSLRDSWNKSNVNYSELETLANELPKILRDFISRLDKDLLKDTYLIRGRKEWHIRKYDVPLILDYMINNGVHLDFETLNDKSKYEFSLIQNSQGIQGFIIYSIFENEMKIYKSIYNNSFISNMLNYYIKRRMTDKKIHLLKGKNICVK